MIRLYKETNMKVIGAFAEINPDEMTEENINEKKKTLAEEIAKTLIDEDLAMVIIKKPEDLIGPFGGEVPDYGTVGVKLFVLPWKEAGAGLTGLTEKEEKDDGR